MILNVQTYMRAFVDLIVPTMQQRALVLYDSGDSAALYS
jgi:hypothetical protein